MLVFLAGRRQFRTRGGLWSGLDYFSANLQVQDCRRARPRIPALCNTDMSYSQTAGATGNFCWWSQLPAYSRWFLGEALGAKECCQQWSHLPANSCVSEKWLLFFKPSVAPSLVKSNLEWSFARILGSVVLHVTREENDVKMIKEEKTESEVQRSLSKYKWTSL